MDQTGRSVPQEFRIYPEQKRTLYLSSGPNGPEKCTACGIEAVLEFKVMHEDGTGHLVGRKCQWCGWRKVV